MGGIPRGVFKRDLNTSWSLSSSITIPVFFG